MYLSGGGSHWDSAGPVVNLTTCIMCIPSVMPPTHAFAYVPWGGPGGGGGGGGGGLGCCQYNYIMCTPSVMPHTHAFAYVPPMHVLCITLFSSFQQTSLA